MSTGTKTPEQIALQLLTVAPVDIDKAIKEMAPIDAQAVVRAMWDIAEKATLFGGYIEERKGTHGCGGRTVTDAVILAFKRRNKVRKALGFNIHDDFRSVMIHGILDQQADGEE